MFRYSFLISRDVIPDPSSLTMIGSAVNGVGNVIQTFLASASQALSTSSFRAASLEIVFNSEIGPAPQVNKNAPAEVAETLSKQALILPNLRKFETTLMERVYFDLLRIFSNSLERDNALLISFGFSFADEHIIDITRRALRNATAQLLIFAYSEAAANAFSTKFSQHRNVLIISPGTGPAIDFAAFNRLLREVGPTSGNTA